MILFRGADKVKKAKSIKVSKGYIKYLWFEELDEFENPEKIRSVQQSVVRGGEAFVVFYSYNPPRFAAQLGQQPGKLQRPDLLEHHSTYLTVPRAWLGEQFIMDAEHLRDTNPAAYEHEYLGKVTGSGAEVFDNLQSRRITDEEISASTASTTAWTGASTRTRGRSTGCTTMPHAARCTSSGS